MVTEHDYREKEEKRRGEKSHGPSSFPSYLNLNVPIVPSYSRKVKLRPSLPVDRVEKRDKMLC